MTFDVTSHWNTLFMHPQRLVDPGSWVRHIPLAFLLIDLARPRTLVELGVHTGNSFSAFCQAVRHFQTNTLCYGVDTFQGDPHAGHYEDTVYDDLSAHIQDQYQDFAQLLRTTFDEAVMAFSDASIDLLHIDGLHTYEAVRHDFDTWLPKVSDQGIVLFHDISARHEDFGAWKVWDELKGAYPSFGFRHGHGLGLLAVGATPPKPVRDLIEALHQDQRIEPVFVTAGDRLANSLQVALLKERNASLAAEGANLRTHADNLEHLRGELERQAESRNTHIQDQLRHIQDMGSLRVEHERLIEEQARHIQDMDKLRTEHERIIHDLERQLGDANQRLHELEQARHALETRHEEAHVLLEQARMDITSLRSSLSWRLTAPLRRVAGFFRGA